MGAVYSLMGFPGGSEIRNLSAVWETWVRSLGWEDPLEEGMATHSSILAGKSHGQRSLVGYSPWSYKESDAMERLSMHTCINISLINEGSSQSMMKNL